MSSTSSRLRLMRQSRTMRSKKRLLCMPVVVLRHWDSAFANKLLFLVFNLVSTILRPTSSLEVNASFILFSMVQRLLLLLRAVPSRAGTSFVDGAALSVRNSELNSTLRHHVMSSSLAASSTSTLIKPKFFADGSPARFDSS
eukprot:3072680-Rhodomonas_salina.1